MVTNPHRDDFTIVIQGPASPISLRNLDNYNKFGRVIVSHWDTDPISLANYECEEVVSDFGYWSGRAKTINNSFNLLYQVVTTLEGLNKVDTKYVIKVRGDEYFTDLTRVVDTVYNNLDHIATTNVFYRPRYFCISDHLIAGETAWIKKAFQELLLLVLSTKKRRICILPEELGMPFSARLLLPNRKGIVPEQCIAMSLLRCKGHMTSNIDIFKRYIKMVPLRELGDICVHSNNVKNQFCFSEKECIKKFGK